MRIFETPEMKIAIFDANIVATNASSDPTQQTIVADTAARNALQKASVNANNILTFTD